jgi:5-methylcytosine-specific restriction endonuclease McrA
VSNPTTKRCGACGRDLPLSAFRAKKDERCARPQTSSDCSECHKAYNAGLRRRSAEERGRPYRTREEIAKAKARSEAERAERVAARKARPRQTHAEMIQRHVDRQRERYAADPNYQAQVKAKKIKRKRAIAGALVEPVNREVVAERDRWRCGICGKKVTRRTWSLDHIVPLVDGGEHSYRNVTLAHRTCNSARGDGRLPVQAPLIARPAATRRAG